MKNTLIIAMLLLSASAWAQESRVTIGGGYVFATIEDSDTDSKGYRINGLYEFNPQEGNIAHGFNIGYIRTTSSVESLLGSTDITIRTWPIYYAPKIMFGKSDKFKAFLKGALGWQFAKLMSDGPAVTAEVKDSGFYGGVGAGGMLFVNEKMFLNLEYEWAYMSNSFYKDGFMNTVQLGVGFKF
jgi:opacity protein-like surface antigen